MPRHKFTVAETLKSQKSRRGHARLIRDLAKLDFQKMLGEKGLALLKEMSSRPEFVPAMLGAAYGGLIGYALEPSMERVAFWAVSGALGATLIVQQSVMAQALGTGILAGGGIGAAATAMSKEMGKLDLGKWLESIGITARGIVIPDEWVTGTPEQQAAYEEYKKRQRKREP